jgi:putative DNA primase/helicase
MEKLETALAYAERGWKVLPVHYPVEGRCSCPKECASPAKHPLSLHGVKDATLDPQVISNWWQSFPEANIGIATGQPLLVVDIDPRHNGLQSFEELTHIFGRLPYTLLVRTGGGGYHYYLEVDKDLKGTVALGGFEGVDVRARGGYVIAPPSLHMSGRSYFFTRDDVPIAQAPSWLEELLTPPERPVEGSYKGDKTAADWLEWAIDRARVGNRNQLGFILACRLRDSGLTRDEALMAMMEYVARTPPGDHPYTQWEAENSVRQAYK